MTVTSFCCVSGNMIDRVSSGNKLDIWPFCRTLATYPQVQRWRTGWQESENGGRYVWPL